MSVRECVQCKARTANGTRCRRTTCTTKDFCAQHTLMNHHLFLQKSQIPNSGKGLYTSRDIPANTDLAEYTGNIVARGVYVHADSGYGVNIPSSGLILDANSTQHGLGRSQHTAATISRFQDTAAAIPRSQHTADTIPRSQHTVAYTLDDELFFFIV